MLKTESYQDEDLETTLMSRAARGDHAAFEDLVRRHQDRLIQFFTVLVRNRAVGEELAQEVFLRLYRARRRYRPTAKFRTFLNQIARNLWIDHTRRRALATVSLDAENAQGNSLSASLASRTEDQIGPERIALRRAVVQLPHDHRLVVLLHLVEGLNYPEIATVLELPLGTVKSRMHHAVHKLRTLMESR